MSRRMRASRVFVFLFLLSSSYCTTEAFCIHSIRSRRRQQPLCLFDICVGIGVIPGSDPERPQKECQDAWFRLDCNRYSCWGVMDGHGTKGHVVTCFFKQELPKILKENLLLMNDSDDRVRNQQDDDVSLQQWEEKLVTLAKVVRVPTINSRNNDIHRVLVKTFHLSHVRAIENPNIPAGCSGTTCIVCVLDKNLKRLHVASVGDSRAILWNNTSDGVLVLAEETTTKLSTELDRIQQCEGRVDTGAGIVFYGPVGIEMTRALGDSVMLRAGVIPTPIVNEYKLYDGSNRIVAATDGIFDVLSNDDVREIVDNALCQEEKDLQHAADILAECAKQKWLGGLPIESKVDDITCIVVEC